MKNDDRVKIVKVTKKTNFNELKDKNVIFNGDVEKTLLCMPEEPIFDLIVSSPPYDIGKSYEKRIPLNEYIAWQKRIIVEMTKRLKDGGSICWEVGNYVENNSIVPLDYLFDPIFRELGFTLRNRIVWHFGHGLNTKRRFSGRYEVVLWYTKGDDYTFNLDDVRIPSKYPGKRYFKGPKKGELSGNPLGKNPEDVWDIPNVKSNHVEKLEHPCQFPVGLIQRLVLALTNKGDMVFDPFSGTASSGVAALLHERKYWGCEIMNDYVEISYERLLDTLDGTVKYRPFDKPIYDPSGTALAKYPEEWKQGVEMDEAKD